MGIPAFTLAVAEPVKYEHISVTHESSPANSLWVRMKRDELKNTLNFSTPLLQEMQDLIQTMKNQDCQWKHNGQLKPVHYLVLGSEHPDYFNLGGDIGHFRERIRARDRTGLYDYSKLCLDILYGWATSAADEMTTISLIQGRALGGGFETALCSDYVIAEEQSTFGFPEITFGLFPCTGGMSLLARRIGVMKAERMLTTPRLYKACELLDMGLIDQVCAKGDGALTVEKYIAEHSKRRVARMILQRGRNRMAPLNYKELSTVVDEWVDAAMNLSTAELRVMEMMVMMQQGSNRQRTEQA